MSPCPPCPVGLPGVQMAGYAGTRGKCVTSIQKQPSLYHFSGMRSAPHYVALESGCLWLSQRSTVHSCYLERNFFLAASMGTLARKPGSFLLSCFPIHISNWSPTLKAAGSLGTCPVEGFMMQPPLSAAILQLQPLSSVSWFIPKLWPSSCARVTAAPRGLSEWSSKKTQEHRRIGHISLALFPSSPSSHTFTFPPHLTESIPLEQGTSIKPHYFLQT